MVPSASTISTIAKAGEGSIGEVESTSSTHQELLGRREQTWRTVYRNRTQGASGGYENKSPPFPLNLPPSYPIYPSASASTAPTRHMRPSNVRHGASVMPNWSSNTSENVTHGHARATGGSNASAFKAKGKRSLDAFMQSRQQARLKDPDPFGSDSDMSFGKIPSLPEDSQNSDSSLLPSSSPPSSSPLCTPRENSPLHTMYGCPSSPTPRPKRQLAARDTSDLPYTLPPGPYSREKPSWSLAALIGQAINASYSGALPLNDIYSYISTVYPHYNRRDQPWMSSVRHSLSVNEAFERVPDQEGSGRRGRGKGMTRLKGGLWRIKPGHQACFEGGNFVRKGAKGAGPGKNLGSRKRAREDSGERTEKKTKGEEPSPNLTESPPRPNSRVASTSSQALAEMTPGPSSSAGPSNTSHDDTDLVHSTSGAASHPTYKDTHSTSSPHSLLQGYSDLQISVGSSPSGSLASPQLHSTHIMARHDSIVKSDTPTLVTLAPGLELEPTQTLRSVHELSMRATSSTEADRDLYTRVLASTSSAHLSSSQGGPPDSARARHIFPPFFSSPISGSSSPVRPTTPPRRQSDSGVTISPARTPISHRGLHMSPSRSLAHYKSSLEPEWKVAHRPVTPPPRAQGSEDDREFSTPNRRTFASGSLQGSSLFQTPDRPLRARRGHGYDPYDPNTLLADELAGIKNSNEQESPGGFFGKEGRKLLYDSPSVPGRSDWRFKDEL